MAKEVKFVDGAGHAEQLNSVFEGSSIISTERLTELLGEEHHHRVGLTATALLYLGIGAGAHAYMVGPVLSFASAWSWGYVLAWPAMLALAFVIWMWPLVLIAGFAIAAVIVARMIWRGLRWLWVLAREANDRRRRDENRD